MPQPRRCGEGDLRCAVSLHYTAECYQHRPVPSLPGGAMSLTAKEVIELLRLEPLPIEGGYYRVTYRADETLGAATLPERYGGPRAYGGAIYFFLHGDNFSALPRLLTDEVYHFYLGQPVEMLLLYPD